MNKLILKSVFIFMSFTILVSLWVSLIIFIGLNNENKINLHLPSLKKELERGVLKNYGK